MYNFLLISRNFDAHLQTVCASWVLTCTFNFEVGLFTMIMKLNLNVCAHLGYYLSLMAHWTVVTNTFSWIKRGYMLCILLLGTIWMQEILPLILSGGDLTAVHTVPNWDRVPWMEETRAPLVLDSKPSPRAMVSHMPYHLMPASFFSSQAKVELLLCYGLGWFLSSWCPGRAPLFPICFRL